MFLPKILICDKVAPSLISSLSTYSLHFLSATHQLVSSLSTYNPSILIVRSTRLTAPILSHSSSTKLIIRAGAGVDTIDVPYCTEKGIYVSNCPGKNSVAVAELVFAHILATDRSIFQNNQSLKNGIWDKGRLSGGRGLKGRRLGIIGFGAIGQAVAKRALAFEMKVFAFDTFWKKGDADWYNSVHFCSRLDQMVKEVDVLTVHVPGSKENKGFINKDFLNLMKKDALLINTSRGDLVVERDLVNHLEENKNFHAGLDVFENEPSLKCSEFHSELAKHPRVNATCHIGASTIQAEEDIANETKVIVEEFVNKGKVLNCVNFKI